MPPHLKRNTKGKPKRQLSLSMRALNASSVQPATVFDISRDSQLAAVATGKSVQLWQINTPMLQTTLDGHSGVVTCVSFAPNSEMLASGAEDKTVVVWGLSQAIVITTFRVRLLFDLKKICHKKCNYIFTGSHVSDHSACCDDGFSTNHFRRSRQSAVRLVGRLGHLPANNSGTVQMSCCDQQYEVCCKCPQLAFNR